MFEFERGIDGIDKLYHPYHLDISLDDLLKESIDFKRNWFAIIRQARENAGFSYSDQFASNAQLRSWAGLSPLPILDSVTNNDTNIVQHHPQKLIQHRNMTFGSTLGDGCNGRRLKRQSLVVYNTINH